MWLYVAIAVGAVLAAILVYRYDLYEREPWYMVLLMGGVGMAAMRVAGWSEETMLDAFADPGLAVIGFLVVEGSAHSRRVFDPNG